MIELLVVKAGDQYYRFSDGEYSSCGLNKASVYPLNLVDEVKLLCRQVTEVEAKLVKLIIIEEPYTE